MKKLFYSGLLLALMLNLNATAQQKEGKETARDGMFIHISHGYDDAHRVAMALNMANMMAEDKDVLVYIDIEGVKFVLKDSEDIKHPAFPSAHESLQKLLDRGIGVYACPGCLKAAGKTVDELMEGVKGADKKAFFNFTDGRIITLDY